MSWPILLTFFYCLAIVLGSLAGGCLPGWLRLTHTRMQLLLSFVGGLMLGVGLFHLLPHGIAEAGNVDLVILWTMAGLLVMFFLIRVFDFHQHTVAPGEGKNTDTTHSHHPPHEHSHESKHSMSWIGVALGLSLHTLIDGVALGAAVVVDASHAGQQPFYGFAIFLAIFLHKPLDAMSITSLMSVGSWSATSRQLVNLGFAAMCPLGAALVFLGFDNSSSNSHSWIGCALGFSAGTFLCISLSDLLPELHFHRHDRLKLSVALLLGVCLAYGIGLIEPRHLHEHSHPTHHPHAPGDIEEHHHEHH